MNAWPWLLAALALAGRAGADELALPAPTLDPAGPVMALWKPSPAAAGALQLDWTDSLGRLVERHRVAVAAADQEVAVPLDLRRAVAADNRVAARFQPQDGGAERRAEASFTLRPAPGWPGYQVLMWQDQPPAALAALRAAGVTGTALLHPPGAMQARRTAGLRWYTENLATDFYASYHRYTSGRAVTWRFDAARAQHRADPADPTVFERVPSLSDPAWLSAIAARLEQVAWQQAPFRPLFHNLADEGGIADLAAAWDFDCSAPSLAAMRAWLQQRYGTLAGLNQAWGTGFAAWDAVQPALTDAAIHSDAALPAWMDGKAWMDTAYVRAVRAGAAALRRGDPAALAGLEGAQPPGWGGYDYGQLAGAVDVMEIYDAGNAVEIARSLSPALHVLTTSSAGGPAERQRLWHEWLLGGQGLVLWDDPASFMAADGQPGPRAAEFAPLLQVLRGAAGSQWLDTPPEPAQVAILYSQPSFRMTWLLDRRADGKPWTDRDAEAEFAANDAWHAANRRAARALAGLGTPARWITPEELAAGVEGTRVLVLPHSVALSDAEMAAIRRFAAAGGLVLGDGPAGRYDELGRARPAPLAVPAPDAMRADGAGLSELAGLLAAAGTPPLRLFDQDGEPARNLDVRLARAGGVLLIGLQRLPGGGGGDVLLRLPQPAFIQPLLGGAAAQADHLTLQLGPVDPVVLAVSTRPVSAVALDGPARAMAGDLVEFRLSLAGEAAHWVDIAVTGPDGAVPALAETIRVPPGVSLWRLRLALSDPPGPWQVQMTDALGGGPIQAALAVR